MRPLVQPEGVVDADAQFALDFHAGPVHPVAGPLPAGSVGAVHQQVVEPGPFILLLVVRTAESDKIPARIVVQETMDFLLALQRHVHAGKEMVIRVRSLAERCFKEGDFGLDDRQGPPVAGASLLDECHVAVPAGDGLEQGDVRPFVDMDEQVVVRMVQQQDQSPEDFRFIVCEDAVCVPGHAGAVTRV